MPCERRTTRRRRRSWTPATGSACWCSTSRSTPGRRTSSKFDYGREFDEWWQRDISAMVLRDRNHPSIVFWGIGNEIPEVLSREARAIAKQLAAQVRSLDSSRPVTQAFPGSTSGPSRKR